MRDLHPEAKALIEAAQQGEAVPSPEALARIHRSVVQRATALAGAAAVTASAGASAKAAVGVSLAAKLIVSSVAGVALSVGLIATHPAWTAPARPPAVEARGTVLPSPSRASTQPERETQAAAAAALIADIPPFRAGGVPEQRAVSAPAVITRLPRPREPVRQDETENRTHARAAQRAGARRGEPAHSAAATSAPRVRDAKGAEVPLEEPPAPYQIVPQTLAAQPTRSAPELAPGGAAPERSRPSASSADARLAAELSLLERVRAALNRGHAERALELLRHHEAIVRDGTLEQQARAAAISALCLLGRDRAARAALERFQRRWSGTLLSTRLQDGCPNLSGD